MLIINEMTYVIRPRTHPQFLLVKSELLIK